MQTTRPASRKFGTKPEKSPNPSRTPIQTPPPARVSTEGITLEQMKACARREFEMRKRVYPNFVGAKRMTQFKADDEIAAMAAILKFLEGHSGNTCPARDA